MIDLASGVVKPVGSDAIYGPVDGMTYAWSPDSKWIAYTIANKAQFRSVWLYSVDDGKTQRLTDGLAETVEPTFDASGKYLYFLASTDAGPVKNWFDQSNADMQATYSVFACVLAKATPNPLAKKEDEEGAADDKAKDQAKEKEGDKDAKPKGPAPKTVIDLDGLEGRIVALPVATGNLQGLASGLDGAILYLRRVGYIPGRAGDGFLGTSSLVRFDLKTREEEVLAEKVEAFRMAADRKHLMYQAKDDVRGIVEGGQVRRRQGGARPPVDLGPGRPQGRVAPDPPRGLADQPRLLLRHQHARGRLVGDPGEVRALPGRGPHPGRPRPGDPDDAQRAGRRPQQQRRRRPPLRAQDDPRRPARGRLRGVRWPLPVPQDLRRPDLGCRPPRAAGGARGRRQGRRISPGRRWRGGPGRPRRPRRVRAEGGPAGRAEGRAEGGRGRGPLGRRRADRRRGAAPEPRLDRAEPPLRPREVRRPGGLRLRPQTPPRRATPRSSGISSRRPTRRP